MKKLFVIALIIVGIVAYTPSPWLDKNLTGEELLTRATAQLPTVI